VTRACVYSLSTLVVHFHQIAVQKRLRLGRQSLLPVRYNISLMDLKAAVPSVFCSARNVLWTNYRKQGVSWICCGKNRRCRETPL